MAGVTTPAYRLAEVAAVLEARRADGVLRRSWAARGRARIGGPGRSGSSAPHVPPCTRASDGADERIRLPPVASRAYASLVHPTGEGPDVDVRTGGDAVRLPLPGGWVATVWGTELHRVTRTVEGLDPRTVARIAA